MADTFGQFIETFIEEVLNEMNFDGISDEEKDQLRDLIGARIDKKIMAVMLEHLPDDKFLALNQKLCEQEWADDEQKAIFTEASADVPDFETKLAEAFHGLKQELLEDAAELNEL